MTPDQSPADPRDIADRVRGILATRNLTLAGASRQSIRTLPEDSRCHLSHNLYYDLHTALFRPDIFQVFALSAISGYRLADWMAVFGFHLEDLPRLQIAIPGPRTALLDATAIDPEGRIPWFVEGELTVPPMAPVSQLLPTTGLRRMYSLPGQRTGHFLYAKIGRQDAFAFPELLPGSVVRVDTRQPDRFLPASAGEASRSLFLIEHTRGMVCCRLRRAGRTRFTLHSSEAPFAEVTLDLGHQARLLGRVDLEFRRLDLPELPEVPRELASFWRPATLPSADRNAPMGEMLRASRLRSGISFRQASARCQGIAKALGDARFSIAASSLSHYETSDDPPRHIHRIFSLCVVYSIIFNTFLDWAGLPTDKAGTDAIPDSWLPRPGANDSLPPKETGTELRLGGFLEHLIQRLEEIPYFLRDSLGPLAGLEDLSPRDVFWIGGSRTSLHPYVRNALFVVTNRRIKSPRTRPSGPLWQQPLFVLVKRDGSYVLGRCSVEGDFLIVHPSSDGFLSSQRYRNRVDAEVVGRVVTIVRQIVP